MSLEKGGGEDRTNEVAVNKKEKGASSKWKIKTSWKKQIKEGLLVGHDIKVNLENKEWLDKCWWDV